MPSPDIITVSQLARLIGTPEAPVIVDVCVDDDFNADPRLIPGSFRHPFNDIEALMPRFQGHRVVVVCRKGHKLGQGAAALLRTNGIAAESLEGGVVAWHEAGEPAVPVTAIPPRRESGETLWVTRHRPKVDRIACPWLIRRFVDPSARFLFVAPAEVMDVADRFGATPFDVEGVFWSHRGEECSFDTMVSEFGLGTEPLKLLATIVRGADTDRHDLAPQAAGLLAASLGLSRMYRDDLRQIDAGMLLYDAFYRWCRDAVDEGHDWPTGKAKA
ncbi:MAG: sulfurtransferase/chromate resistance protein [Parvibaculum sp.]|uniref:sulfurtransferase/chromate resistance protein n=1 Tax=Alphaproteobacteria TaxID=28211 RepID=UPI00329A3296